MLSRDEILKDLLLLFPGYQEIPPLWDSLKHLEIITYFERKEKIHFTIQEVINTHNKLEALIELIGNKTLCP